MKAKNILFRLYVNDIIYGKGNMDYMLELINDYCRTHMVYNRSDVDFRIEATYIEQVKETQTGDE